MVERYDMIVVGAGLNGLVAAAYLARAGRSVLVLERRETVGGAASTEEFAPGFRGPATWASAELFHPEIRRELELEKHGLELLTAAGGVTVASLDGEGLVLPAGDAAAGALSQADADALRQLEAFRRKLGGVLEPVLTRPLPTLEVRGPGDVWELLTLGLELRGLGRRDMPEAMRFLPMPIRDVLDERFESPALRAALAAPALTASWLAPRSAGSALTLLHRRPAWVDGLVAAPVFVAGGPGALAAAVAAAARSHGAEIRTESAVERITIDGEGRATGVVLASGDQIAAGRVVSALDPKRTLLDLAEPGWLEPDQLRAVRGIRTRGTVAIVRLAVDEPPSLRGGLPLDGRVQIGGTLDALERAFDPVKYGELPAEPWLEITVPSLVDPSLAPDGKHVVHVWVQWVPYALRDGSWDARRDELGDLVVERIEAHAPGFASRVEHRDVSTPLDLERRWGFSGGTIEHAEPALDQLLYLRPLAGFYQYRTPIERLHLCGPGTHPGVGMTGLCGKNAATQVLEDHRDDD